MSKDRESVTTNGRAAFYACMWDDFRQAAMDCGWALGLHGSLASDMDIRELRIEDRVSHNGDIGEVVEIKTTHVRLMFKADKVSSSTTARTI